MYLIPSSRVCDYRSGSSGLLSLSSLASCAILSQLLISVYPNYNVVPCLWRVSTNLSSPSLNFSVFATKSVSQCSSTIVNSLFCLSILIPTYPSDVALPTFFSASAKPLFLNKSFAYSMSPLVSSRTFIQSFRGLPVISLSYFTSLGEIDYDENNLIIILAYAKF